MGTSSANHTFNLTEAHKRCPRLSSCQVGPNVSLQPGSLQPVSPGLEGTIRHGVSLTYTMPILSGKSHSLLHSLWAWPFTEFYLDVQHSALVLNRPLSFTITCTHDGFCIPRSLSLPLTNVQREHQYPAQSDTGSHGRFHRIFTWHKEPQYEYRGPSVQYSIGRWNALHKQGDKWKPR